ncbi:DUF2759 domain-containing protein [Aquibacillus kalidii]|uniref:DUF2759 domain-containing protein n=1 Tax=Aquibacillus kalidii TaxID=2762597 RepID=UPI001645E8C4|nr:DUF2759 domain-containing protein [Aquibacillus kalidii]
MVLAILLLIVTILCAVAVIRELKNKNLFAVAFAGLSAAVFGFFSIATIYVELFHDKVH